MSYSAVGIPIGGIVNAGREKDNSYLVASQLEK